MNKKRFVGILLFLAGVILLINSSVNITGAVIGAPEVIRLVQLVLGLVFIGGGVVVLMRGRDSGESKLKEISEEDEELSDEDREILRYLSSGDQSRYISRKKELEEIKHTVGGEAPFYVPPLERGDVVYVHLTTSKKKANQILREGLKHGGPSTYGQAFIFTGSDARSKAISFVDSLSSKGKYVGVQNPTNAIIFKTQVIPTLNQFSGAIPKNYRGRWKAMFRYDLPSRLMENVENIKLSA